MCQVKKLLPGEEWLGLIGLVPLAGGVACIGLAAVRSFRASAATFALAAVCFVVLLFAVGTDRVDRHQTNHRLWQAIYARSSQPIVASYKVLEPSWVFYGGRPIHEIGAGSPADGQIAPELAVSLLAASENAFVITTGQRLAELSPRLPPGVGVLEAVPYFMHGSEQLVVLGHVQQAGPVSRAGWFPPASDGHR